VGLLRKTLPQTAIDKHYNYDSNKIMFMQIRNYKNEIFYSVENIQDDMKAISKGLKDNFSSDIYIPVKEFGRGVKNKTSLKNFIKDIHNKQPAYKTGKQKNENDYSGIYLFASKKASDFIYQYVGISQQVISRLKQHVTFSNKSSASWAYMMAKVEHNRKNKFSTDITKNNFETTEDAKNAILKQQEKIAEDFFVTYYPVDDNFLLHKVEPYVACDLKCYWNSFETH